MSHVQFKTLRWSAKTDGNWLRRHCQASGLYTTSLAYCTSIRDRNSDSVLPGRKDKRLGERLKPLKWPKRKGSFIEAGKKGKAVHLMTCKQSHSECNTEQLRYKQSPWLAQKEDKGKKTHFHFTCKITTLRTHMWHTRGASSQYKFACRYEHELQIRHQQLDAILPRQTG